MAKMVRIAARKVPPAERRPAARLASPLPLVREAPTAMMAVLMATETGEAIPLVVVEIKLKS